GRLAAASLCFYRLHFSLRFCYNFDEVCCRGETVPRKKGVKSVFYNIKVYVYSILLVIGTVFPLRKAKKLAQKKHITSIDDELFQTPHTVAQKIVHTTKTPVYGEGKDNLPEGPALSVANHQ